MIDIARETYPGREHGQAGKIARTYVRCKSSRPVLFLDRIDIQRACMKNARLKPLNRVAGRQIIEFRALGLDHGKIDKDKGIIHDVSLITSHIEARGHDLHTDDVTLEQVCDLASAMGQVPVKWNHKTGADSVNGYVTNFRVAGNKTKADWHLLMSHPNYDQAIELAERMPGNVGLSVAFVGAEPESKNGKKFARVEELVSVDLVAQPAANPGGLFEEGDVEAGAAALVDRLRTGKLMSTPNAAAAAAGTEPTIADVLEAIKGQNETIATLQQQLQGVVNAQRANEPLSLDELERIAQLDDAQLAGLDLTREEVDQAVADAMSGVEDPGLEQVDGGDGPQLQPGGGVGAVAGVRGRAAGTGDFVASGARGAAANVPSEVVAELQDLRKRVTRFERQQTLEKQEEEAEALQEFFNSIEEKVQTLEARNEALETAFTAGGGQVSASGEFVMPKGVLADGSVTPGTKTEFENLVDTKIVELQTADPKKPAFTARREAIQFVQKTNRAAYTKHLEAKGVQLQTMD